MSSSISAGRAPRLRRPTARVHDPRTPLRFIAAIATLLIISALPILAGRALVQIADIGPANPPDIAAPVPGTRTLNQPLSLLLAVDASGSMEASDPRGLRYLDARAVVRWLGDHSENTDDRFGSIHFASNPGLELPPIPVQGNLPVIDAALQKPATDLGGGTNIVGALESIDRLIASTTGTVPVVVILSDGLPNDGDYGAVGEAIRSLQANVWLIAFDFDVSYSAQAKPAWDRFAISGTIRLDSLDSGSVANAIATIVTVETGQSWAVSTP